MSEEFSAEQIRRERVFRACQEVYRQLESYAGTALDVDVTDTALATAWEEFQLSVLPARWEIYLDDFRQADRRKLRAHLYNRAVSRTIDERRANRLDTTPLERDDGSNRPDVESLCSQRFEERVLALVGADVRLKNTYSDLPTESLRRGFLGIFVVGVLGWPRRHAAEVLQIRDSALGKYMNQARTYLRSGLEAARVDGRLEMSSNEERSFSGSRS